MSESGSAQYFPTYLDILFIKFFVELLMRKYILVNQSRTLLFIDIYGKYFLVDLIIRF